MMNIESIFSVSASAIDAQTQRMSVLASNMANSESFNAEGKAYEPKRIVFQTRPLDQEGLLQSVEVAQVITPEHEQMKRFDPSHPMADDSGYVMMPNINPVTEMVELIDASRAYQANLEIMNTTRDMAMKTISLIG